MWLGIHCCIYSLTASLVFRCFSRVFFLHNSELVQGDFWHNLEQVWGNFLHSLEMVFGMWVAVMQLSCFDVAAGTYRYFFRTWVLIRLCVFQLCYISFIIFRSFLWYASVSVQFTDFIVSFTWLFVFVSCCFFSICGYSLGL
jgi:hypothetical protein